MASAPTRVGHGSSRRAIPPRLGKMATPGWAGNGLAAPGAEAGGKSTGGGSTPVSLSSLTAKPRAGTARDGSWAGGQALASASGIGAANGVTGASGGRRTVPVGPWPLSAGLGDGAGGGAGASFVAGTRLCAVTGACIKMVRPFCPSSAKKPGYAGECAFAPDDAGGTDALGAAAGAEVGKAAGDGAAGGTGAGGEAGIAGGAAATGLAGGAAGDFAGGAAFTIRRAARLQRASPAGVPPRLGERRGGHRFGGRGCCRRRLRRGLRCRGSGVGKPCGHGQRRRCGHAKDGFPHCPVVEQLSRGRAGARLRPMLLLAVGASLHGAASKRPSRLTKKRNASRGAGFTAGSANGTSLYPWLKWPQMKSCP